MAKKRYVGFKYENPDDKEPVFDAKGIETVRRDGIPAGQKMVEKCLKILFRSQDLSEAKAYSRSAGGEPTTAGYSDKGPPPPGVVVAARRVTKDPRAEAQYGDRVPYVIVRGEPKSRLVDRAFEPLDVLKDRHQYQLDAHYYIEHQLIPPLERVFNLVGANVASWYAEMPKVARPFMPEFLAPERRIADARAGPSKPKFTIDEHFKSASCVVCGKPSAQVLCPACTARPQETAFALETLRRDVQRRAAHTQQICASCCGAPAGEEIECESVDCAWLYERYKAGRELRAVTAPTTDWAPNGRALSPPPASPRSAARFAAASSSTGNGSKGASWLFTQLSTRPKISNGIEHQVQQNGGLKPPVIDEADEREGGAEPSNASVLSFSSSVDVASEPGLGRNGTVRSADHVLSRASDDGYVRVNKPSVPSTMRKSDTMPRPRTSDTLDRLKEAASSSSNIPLTSLYLVSGLPKNPATWTLADADSVVGVHHSEGAVGRWWRAEVLGSTITPGVNGGKDKKKKRGNKSRAGESAESKAGLGKGDLGKMLSKSLKLSFPREVEIIASTLQPASTIHSFTFSVPTTRDLTAPASASHLRASVFSTTTAASGTIGDRNSYLGQPGLGHGMHLGIPGGSHIGLPPPDLDLNTADPNATPKETMYHGVCLTVWSHADEERTAAIRRTLETAAYARSRTHKVSMSSMATSIAPSVATSTGRSTNGNPNRPRKRSMPWSGTEVDESETDAGAMTESEADFAGNADGAGASTLFLPQNTVFWLPYAL
ncbi:DNA polymerase zeta, partial [Tulasnella sp. 408]